MAADEPAEGDAPSWRPRYDGGEGGGSRPAGVPGFISPYDPAAQAVRPAAPAPQAQPLPPPQWPGPLPPLPGERRGGATATRMALLGLPLVIVAALLVVLLLPRQASSPVASGPVATPVPTPAASVATLRGEYAAATQTVIAADDHFAAIIRRASATRCGGCPPGYFDAGPIYDALPSWVQAHKTWSAALRQMAATAPSAIAQDLQALAGYDEDNISTWEELVSSPGVATVSGVDQAMSGDKQEAQVEQQVRQDLGLPASSSTIL